VSGTDELFHADTPLGFRVTVTAERWRLITFSKHPVMKGREQLVEEALNSPDAIRRSRGDADVLLFYRVERPGRWTCAVVRRSGERAFLITAYPTDAVKEGEQTWAR
jgi:hypothetical protein